MTLLEQPIRGLTKDLSKILAKLPEGTTPKNIHRLRTTIRRIESIVGYARPDLGRKLERSLESLEDLRKRAGKVRNVDVQKKLLEKIGNGSTAKDRKKLADVLDKKRGKHLQRLRPAVARCADQKFLARVEKVADRIALAPLESGQILAPLEEARLELSTMADHFSSHSIKPNRLHQARIQLKKLRYVAELAEESPESKAFVEEIKNVQDTVGEWHDWEELAGLAEKHFADRANCALLREIRALFAARQSAAISAITRLFASASAPPARKPPTAVQPIRMSSRRAG